MARHRASLPALARAVVAITAITCAAVLLSGCTAAPVESAPTPSATTPSAPQKSPTPTPTQEPEVERAPESTPLAGACAGMPGLQPRSNEDPDRVYGYLVPDWKDSGVREGATGEVALDADGRPASYVVAEGDVPFAISERFCIGHVPYLAWLNSIRRDSGYAIALLNSR